MGTVRYKVSVKDGKEIVEEIHKVVVHRFKIGDVEDPILYAGEPLYQWEKSDQGQFVMKHAIDKPVWHQYNNFESFGYEFIIVAELEKKKLSEFYLRWGKI